MGNTNNPYGFRPDQFLYGGTGAFPVWEGKVLSNHVFTFGDAVYASAGYLRNAATSDKAIVGVCAANRVRSNAGLYPSRQSNAAITKAVGRPKMLFYPALDGVVYSGQCSGTTSCTQGIVWTLRDIEGTAANSTGVSSQKVNEDAVTNKNIYVIGWRGNTSAPGAYAEVLFTFAKNKFSARGIDATSTTLIGS